jgi:hypothetical protein
MAANEREISLNRSNTRWRVIPAGYLDNAAKLIGMPAFVGDPTWRYNISG